MKLNCCTFQLHDNFLCRHPAFFPGSKTRVATLFPGYLHTDLTFIASSVKETMANTTFTNHPQGRLMPQTSFYDRRPPQHQSRQFQTQPHLRLRTMAITHQRPHLDTGEYGSGLSQPISAGSSFTAEACNTPPSAASDTSFHPEEYFQLPEDTSSSTWSLQNASWPDFSAHSTVNHFPFRPTGVDQWQIHSSAPVAVGQESSSAVQPSAGGNVNIASARDDSSPKPVAAPPVLPHSVDTSQYQNVPDEDWVLSYLDYDSAPSPSSVDSHGTGPHTPISPAGGELFGTSLFPSNSNLAYPSMIPKVETEPSAFSITPAASWSGSFSSDSTQISASTVASFGGLTYPRHFAQPSGYPLPLSAIPSSVAAQGSAAAHGHGPPIYAATHTISPPALINPQHAVQSFTGSVQDLDQRGWETSPEASGSDDESSSDVNDQAIEEARLRRDRDKYLLKMRERGLSYKEIKRRGKFKEAESTLRGRIRVLTKDKSERVRRPDWTENDLQLLEQAVNHFGRFDGTVRGREAHSRVPWKKISDWMRSRGSSYTFAPATCAKKYRELHSL
ncbi:hypothetical protein AC578_1210 [Pseudocercospora eumusae]|uniref:Myb-like domain-containing protein n=1 Tax=Pseudocercospora eumusae TaxID=321146 RepID=A0A139HCV7_9PEZI|nr:hypothetical protein AC578_1210 [Pseudocercospora eumusae]